MQHYSRYSISGEYLQAMLPALESLLGKDAKGLSANSICRLKERWYAEYEQWRKRDLKWRHYVYVWADGVLSR